MPRCGTVRRRAGVPCQRIQAVNHDSCRSVLTLRCGAGAGPALTLDRVPAGDMGTVAGDGLRATTDTPVQGADTHGGTQQRQEPGECHHKVTGVPELPLGPPATPVRRHRIHRPATDLDVGRIHHRKPPPQGNHKADRADRGQPAPRAAGGPAPRTPRRRSLPAALRPQRLAPPSAERLRPGVRSCS